MYFTLHEINLSKIFGLFLDPFYCLTDCSRVQFLKQWRVRCATKNLTRYFSQFPAQSKKFVKKMVNRKMSILENVEPFRAILEKFILFVILLLFIVDFAKYFSVCEIIIIKCRIHVLSSQIMGRKLEILNNSCRYSFEFGISYVELAERKQKNSGKNVERIRLCCKGPGKQRLRHSVVY